MAIDVLGLAGEILSCGEGLGFGVAACNHQK